MKWAAISIAVIVVAYVIYAVAIISWPNPLKRPADQLQRECAAQFPIGMLRMEAEGRLAEQGLTWRRGREPQLVIAAVLGSYATSNMLFIFPMYAVVVLQLSFDETAKIASVKVWKYVDGP